MGIRLRWTIWTGVAVAAAVVSSAGVLAAGTSSSNVSGFEIAATSTDGQFVGSIGTGTALAGGYFYANVFHQALTEAVTAICGTGETSATPSPPFPCDSMDAPISTVTVDLPGGNAVTGDFEYADSGGLHSNQGIVFEGNSGGTSSCPARQYFSVADVVNFNQLHDSYEFSVTLTHYSYDFFGDCITYFATISGTMTLQQSN